MGQSFTDLRGLAIYGARSLRKGDEHHDSSWGMAQLLGVRGSKCPIFGSGSGLEVRLNQLWHARTSIRPSPTGARRGAARLADDRWRRRNRADVTGIRRVSE